MERYRYSERGRYEPPACPHCGHRADHGWIDVTCRADPEPMFIPGRWQCRTDGCPYNPESHRRRL